MKKIDTDRTEGLMTELGERKLSGQNRFIQLASWETGCSWEEMTNLSKSLKQKWRLTLSHGLFGKVGHQVFKS